MAPEVAASAPYNHKAEIFSFATVVWEMAALKKPFLEYSFIGGETLFVKQLKAGAKPQVRKHWDGRLQSLLLRCWSLEHEKRPEMREVVPIFEALAKAEREKEEAKSMLKTWLHAMARR